MAPGDSTNTFFLSGGEVADLFFGFKQDNWSVQLNIFNVLGEDAPIKFRARSGGCSLSRYELPYDRRDSVSSKKVHSLRLDRSDDTLLLSNLLNLSGCIRSLFIRECNCDAHTYDDG